MNDFSEKHFVLLNFISAKGKSMDDISNFQPSQIYWPHNTTGTILKDLEWANLIEFEQRFVRVNEYGVALIKKHKIENRGKWIKLNPIKFEILKAVITAAFTLAVGILTGIIHKPEEDQKYKELKLQLEQVSKKVDSLPTPQKGDTVHASLPYLKKQGQH
jgi:hypothetical protein